MAEGLEDPGGCGRSLSKPEHLGVSTRMVVPAYISWTPDYNMTDISNVFCAKACAVGSPGTVQSGTEGQRGLFPLP